VDDGWPPSKAAEKIGGGGIPVALDPKRLTAKAFGTEKFPETYVITADGILLERYEGAIDWNSPGSGSRSRTSPPSPRSPEDPKARGAEAGRELPGGTFV